MTAAPSRVTMLMSWLALPSVAMRDSRNSMLRLKHRLTDAESVRAFFVPAEDFLAAKYLAG